MGRSPAPNASHTIELPRMIMYRRIGMGKILKQRDEIKLQHASRVGFTQSTVYLSYHRHYEPRNIPLLERKLATAAGLDGR